MRARVLYAVAALIAFMLAFAPAAFAVPSPHGDYAADSVKCSSCHSLHAGGSSLLLRDGSPEALCLSCHDGSDGSDVKTSVTAGSDARTRHDISANDRAASGSSLTCTSCHAPHRSSSRAKYVDPDDPATVEPSALAPLVDRQGHVYVLVGAAHDGRPPTLSAIVLDSSADGTAPTVSWTTDEEATTWIDWGLTTGYEAGNEATGTPFGTELRTASHRVAMSGLVPGQTYHYRVRSEDALGNRSVSADRTYTAFVTPPPEEAVAVDSTTTLEASAQLMAAESTPTVTWLTAHDPYVFDTQYSVDSDWLELRIEPRSSQPATMTAAAGWESASAEVMKPTPQLPGSAVDASVLAGSVADDETYWRTDRATVDGEWNWQVVRFDTGVADVTTLAGLSLVWNGHGEPTPGYATAVYLWDAAQGWVPVSVREVPTDTDITAERKDVSSAYCLTCHDGAPPAGVAPSVGLTDVATSWAADRHGDGAGVGSGASTLKPPYSRSAAAIDCTVCHDTHGSASIYHVPGTVNGSTGVIARTGSELRTLCASCHEGSLREWHGQCVDCHENGHWAGWVDPPVSSYLPTESSDCTSCHGHGSSWTHPATCVRCHGEGELKALGAQPDAAWTYERTF